MDNGREDKNPWTKWFWADYEADIGLRACSLAAQGLWVRMLSYMARSKKKGFLLDGEKQMESKTLAKLIGEPEPLVKALIEELLSHGDGAVFAHDAFAAHVEERVDPIGFFDGAQGVSALCEALVRTHACGTVDAQVVDGSDPSREGGVEFGKAFHMAAFEAQSDFEVVLDRADEAFDFAFSASPARTSKHGRAWRAEDGCRGWRTRCGRGG